VAICGAGGRPTSRVDHDVKPISFFLKRQMIKKPYMLYADRHTNYRTTAQVKGWSLFFSGKPWVVKVGADWRHPSGPGPPPSGWLEHPVTHVSWYDSQAFCIWLSRKLGHEYRLPTEAEWEYAARAGSEADYCFGDEVARLADYGWYRKNSKFRLHRAAALKPNQWGLFDMHGNLNEWVSDWHRRDYYQNSPSRNPKGPTGGKLKVMRGGAWIYKSSGLRVSTRVGDKPDRVMNILGFRVVRVLR
jgi:formylglycine-generating enzyme required for sulfatase activity